MTLAITTPSRPGRAWRQSRKPRRRRAILSLIFRAIARSILLFRRRRITALLPIASRTLRWARTFSRAWLALLYRVARVILPRLLQEPASQQDSALPRRSS